MNRVIKGIVAAALLTGGTVAGAATTINGTFAAGLGAITSSTFGIGAGTTFSNATGLVTDTTGQFSAVPVLTTVNFDSVTAMIGSSVSFSSSFGSFAGTIQTMATPLPAPNAVVSFSALGNFTPTGSLSGFDAGIGSLTVSFTQTGNLIAGRPQPAISGSFTFASEAGGGNPNPVPEPATWALLLTGFGMIGATIRRRRGTVVAA